MAVHVVLDRDAITSILSLYHLEGLEDFHGIAEGSINTSYWVQVAGRRYFLRVTEKKRVKDMVFERELLEHLGRASLPVPRLIENVARGTFTPWGVGGRFVSLFEYLDGRELGVFEVRPAHAQAVGHFAAKMHLATHEFRRVRQNEFDIPSLEKKLRRLLSAVEQRRLKRAFATDLAFLGSELELQKRRDFAHLTSGTVHGDLFVDNVKFKEGKLSGVIDFEMSSSERFIWELAVSLNAWCWEPSAVQEGGPKGHFDLARSRALLRGYGQTRELTRHERAALPDDLRLAAARFAISRLTDFELHRLPPERRVYKDYRHYLERLRMLKDGGAERIVVDAFGEP